MKVARPRHSIEEMLEIVPEWWDDNGNSDKLKFLWFLVYSRRTRYHLERYARGHDWLYSPGQLAGAPLGTFHWDRDEGDRAVYWYLKDRGMWMAARNQYKGLKQFGGWSWRKNAKTMREMGDRTYEHYVRRRKLQVGVS